VTGAIRDDADHGVVDRSDDGPIVNEPSVSDAAEFVESAPIVIDQRFAFAVAAGAHKRAADGVAKLGVKRSRRQHQADGLELRGDFHGEFNTGPATYNDDRAGRVGKKPAFRFVEHGQVFRCGEIGDKHRERLGYSSFSIAKSSHGCGRCRIGQELVSAKPFQGHDLAGREQFGGDRESAFRFVFHAVLIA